MPRSTRLAISGSRAIQRCSTANMVVIGHGAQSYSFHASHVATKEGDITQLLCSLTVGPEPTVLQVRLQTANPFVFEVYLN